MGEIYSRQKVTQIKCVQSWHSLKSNSLPTDGDFDGNWVTGNLDGDLDSDLEGDLDGNETMLNHDAA